MARSMACQKKRLSSIHCFYCEEFCKSDDVGAFCANGRCGLWFMPEGTFINGTVYIDVLKATKFYGNQSLRPFSI